MNFTGLNRDPGTALDRETQHDYDGIREFDNPLPRWWLFTFYGAVVFSVGYWFYYHTLAAGELPMAAYMAELEAAEKLQLATELHSVSEAQLLTLAQNHDAVQRGAAVFKQNCVTCHGDRGQGVVGPNLTDAYWLHGGTAKQIHHVITTGLLDKGMPSWRPVLGATKVQDTTAFVLSLRGKNEPGRPAQGVSDDGRPAP